MKKINFIKKNKIWGYEKWLYSPLPSNQTLMEDLSKITKGPLVKIIYAKQPLSVQVHPDDKLAKKLENQDCGKSESWFILDVKKESEFVVGIKTYDHNKILNSLREKKFDDLLIKIIPQKNDVINVPSGMIHSVGKNSKILEIQQPSDITYRFYDFQRLENNKPRELHIEKSLLALKKTSHKIKLLKKEPITYKFLNYKIIICKRNTTLEKKSIIIDLIKEQGYLAQKNEFITLNYFAIIEL